MAAILTKKQALLIKIETTRGVDASPDATNAVEAENVDFSIIQDVQERSTFKRSLGNSKHVALNSRAQITFEYILRVTNAPASGSSGSPEFINPMFRASGLTPTYNASADITYNLVNQPEETATIYFYNDGLLFKLTGCVAQCNMELPTNGFSKCTFTFEGFYNAPTATAIPANIEDAFSTKDAVPCVGCGKFPEGELANLKALYFFSSDVTEDHSGNSNTLTNNNTAIPFDLSVRGIGITLDGSDQYMSRAHDADFDFGTDDFTFFMWIKHPSVASPKYFFDRRDTSGLGMTLYINASGNIVAFLKGASGDTTITSSTTVDDDALHFIVVRRTSNTLEIYIDDMDSADVSGSLASVGSITGAGDDTLEIGRKNDDTSYFNGEMVWYGICDDDDLGTAQKRKDMKSFFHDRLVRTVTIDFGNSIFTEISDKGVSDFRISQRNITGSITIEHPSLTYRDFYNEAIKNNPDEVFLQSKIGFTASNSQVFVKCRAQFQTLNLADDEGIRTLEIPFQLVESDGNIDDQLEIVFK